jgi:hypothetical protein
MILMKNIRYFNGLAVWTLIMGLISVQSIYADAGKASAKVDRLVSSKLDEFGIPPSDACTDEVFLRRAYIDVIGTLPSSKEARKFLDSVSPNRKKLIEDLLARDEFADYWAMKWCDLLRVKAEFPSNLWPNAVQAYHRWVRTALYNNMPYDEFARRLLTSSGSNFRVAPVNFFRAVPKREAEEISQIVALTFMGMRTDGWEQDQRLGMAAFFGNVGYKKTAEWKEEIIFFDPTKTFCYPETEDPVPPKLPNGTRIIISEEQDPRAVFADWLIDSDIFSQCIVNRIWYWLMGRGLVQEPDDFREDNPPQNPELLSFLTKELVASGYDLRHIYRIILNSKTYQLSSIHNEANLSDTENFSHYYVRRLDAEVLIDAICQITKTTESYSSAIPEPFTWIPEGQRSIAWADGSITSPFLDLYGRPPRDSGYESERNNTPSGSQKLHLLNSTHVQLKILNNKGLLGMYFEQQKGKKKPKTSWKSPDKTLENIYLTILSRYPTEQEKKVARAYFNQTESRYNAGVDIIWALLNTKEFIYRH